jgi:hypothetical protein
MLLTAIKAGLINVAKLSFVVSFHCHQLPNFQGRTLSTSCVLDRACCRICTSDDMNYLAYSRSRKQTTSTYLEGRPGTLDVWHLNANHRHRKTPLIFGAGFVCESWFYIARWR